MKKAATGLAFVIGLVVVLISTVYAQDAVGTASNTSPGTVQSQTLPPPQNPPTGGSQYNQQYSPVQPMPGGQYGSSGSGPNMQYGPGPSVQGGQGQFGPQGPGQFGSQGFGGQQFGPNSGGHPGDFGTGQGFGSGGQGGDFEERSRQMHEQQEKMRLQGMKQGVRMMTSHVARVTKRFAALEARKIPISTEAKDALQAIKDIIQKVTTAQSIEDLETVDMSEVQDAMQEINEGLQKAEVAAQFPQILKQANREIAQQQAALKRAEARVKRLKIDGSALVAEWRTAINTLAEVKTQAEQLFRSGETEEAITMLHDDFFGETQSLRDREQIFTMISNSAQIVRMATSEIQTAERMVVKLKKQGEDTAALGALITKGKGRIAEIKAILAVSPIDSQALIDALEGLREIKSEFDGEVSELSGLSGPSIPGLRGFQPIQMPQGFNQFFRDEGREGGSQSGLPGGSGSGGGFGPMPAASPPNAQASIIQSAQSLLEQIKIRLDALRQEVGL
ncbi:hypothetical protein HY504_01445 [Candidatus Wolfebacteria bacterium]|nr:hypothetical protein [Candidatus Wolfebacteria bacterium]